MSFSEKKESKKRNRSRAGRRGFGFREERTERSALGIRFFRGRYRLQVKAKI